MSTELEDARFREALAPHYLIEHRLGSGGMGLVYLAHDPKHERRVALKVLRPDLGVDLSRERFRRELSIATSLQHPNIVPIYDSGESGGILYFVMPYVEGESLSAQLSARGPLALEAAMRVGRDIGTALSHAHQRGVVHRDVKPSNVLITGGVAMVSDFGIATVLGGSPHDLSSQSLAVGTPAYMSPEQAEGRADPRSDQYSLACVLYELLCGEPPFRGPSTQAVIARHAIDPPPGVRTIRPEVPEHVERAIHKALAKLPVDRFRTVDELLRALGESSGELSVARLSIRDRKTTEGSLALAVLPFRPLGDEDRAYFCDGMTDLLITTLSRSPSLRVVSRRTVDAAFAQKLDLATLGERLGVSSVVQGSVRWQGDSVRIDIELTQVADGYNLWAETFKRKADDLFLVQEDVARAIGNHLRVRLTGSQTSVLIRRGTDSLSAYNKYLRGRYAYSQRSEDGFTTAIHHFESALVDDPEYALAYAGIADCYVGLSQFQFLPARVSLPQAEKAAREALRLAPNLAEIVLSWAHICEIYRWSPSEAEYYYRRAIELSPDNATAHAWLADMLLLIGQQEEAFELSKRARTLEPFAVALLNQYGTLLYRSGQHDAAERVFRDVVAQLPALQMAHTFLCFSLCAQGRTDDALRHVEEVIAGQGPSPTLELARGFARARGKREDLAESLAVLDRLATERYVPAAHHAILYAGSEQLDKCFFWLERALHERSVLLLLMTHEEYMRSVWADPRFDQLVQRVGFQNGARQAALDAPTETSPEHTPA